MSNHSESGAEPSGYRLTLQPTTRTVTTTTTTETTHSFPPVHFSRPERPRNLDKRAYPLVDALIPDEIKEFQVGFSGILADATVDLDERYSENASLLAPIEDIHGIVRAALPDDPLKSPAPLVSSTQLPKKRYRDDTPVSRQSQSPPLPSTQANNYLSQQTIRKRQKGLTAADISPRRREASQASIQATLSPGLSGSAAFAQQTSREDGSPSSRIMTIQTGPLRDPSESVTPPSSVAAVPLPSPRQSPIPTDDESEEPEESEVTQTHTSKNETKSIPSEKLQTPHVADPRLRTDGNMALAVLLSLPGMLADFDMLPSGVKNYCLYELLRRCEVPNLRFASQVIGPALKRDFISDLPYEIALKIVRELDFASLCQATQVSRTWHAVVDSDILIWRERLIEDGFEYVVNPIIVAAKENEEAVKAIWGLVQRVAPMTTPSTMAVPNQGRASIPFAAHSRLLSQDSPSARFTSQLSGLLDASRRIDSSSFSTIQQRLMPFFNSPQKPEARAYPDPLKVSASPAREVLGSNQQSAERSQIPMLGKIENPFKDAYRREFVSERNWYSEEPKVVSFQGVGTRVITCLQFDDDKIIAGSEDKTIKVYDTQTGRLWKNLEGHDGGVWALQYIGNVLVSGSTDRTVKIWNIREGRCTHTFTGHTSTVRCLQIILPTPIRGSEQEASPKRLPQWPVIVTGSRDATLRVWRLPVAGFDSEWHPEGLPTTDDAALPVGKNPYFQHLLLGHEQSVRALSGFGTYLASGSYDRSVNIWDLTKGTLIYNLTGHEEKVYAVIMDPVRHQVMSGSLDSRVRIWSLETGACLHDLRGHTSLVGLLDLSHSFLVSAAADGTLRVWDPVSGQCVHMLKAHQGAITCFQHSETKIISGSDGTLKLWDLRTGEPIRDLLKDLSAVWQVRFDDRRCVAAVERNGTTWFEVLDFGDPDEPSPHSTLDKQTRELGIDE